MPQKICGSLLRLEADRKTVSAVDMDIYKSRPYISAPGINYPGIAWDLQRAVSDDATIFNLDSAVFQDAGFQN
jgi:hypothetical protein